MLHRHLWGRNRFIGYDESPRGIFGFSREWWEYAKLPIDDRPDNPNVLLEVIRTWFFATEWYHVYEFVEFVIPYLERTIGIETANACVADVNRLMERALSGFRFVKEQFIRVTDPQEIEAIQAALQETPYAGVKAHLTKALEHMSRRENPDYRNSIKESISAVESLCREVTANPKATLGDALKVLEKNGALHEALKEGMSRLYGYTSDEGGIRHSMLVEPNIDANDAKFFLIKLS